MTEQKIAEMITEMAHSLQTRNYDQFVSHFADDAIFEIPFMVNGGTTIYGKENISKHFENVRQNPLTKLIEIDTISTIVHQSSDNKTITVEYFTKGKSLSTNEPFEIQSSIAVIEFSDEKISHYKDFPNTLGIAMKAGVLSQLAQTWIK